MKEQGKKTGKGFSFPILGVLLILVAVTGVMLAKSGETPKESAAEEEALDTESFRADAQKQLEQLLGGLEGVGKVRVMVTVETTPAKVYAEDTQSSCEKNDSEYVTNVQTQTVFSQEGGKEKAPVLLYRVMPRIGGVAVVCPGAKDPEVRWKIIDLVAGLFGIGTNRVCVTN